MNAPHKFSSVTPLRSGGSAAPLFFVHGVGGVLPELECLLSQLDARHPIYSIHSQAFDPEAEALLTLQEMAAYYLREIQKSVAEQPYIFIGLSFGGMVAFEMAQQLRTQGAPRPYLFMIDSSEMSRFKRQARSDSPRQRIADLSARLKMRFLDAVRTPNRWAYLSEKIVSRSHRMLYSIASRFGVPVTSTQHNPYHVNWFAAVNYSPESYDQTFTLFKAEEHFWEPRTAEDLGWRPLAQHGLDIVEIPGNHASVLQEPNVRILAAELNQRLSMIQDLLDSGMQVSSSLQNR